VNGGQEHGEIVEKLKEAIQGLRIHPQPPDVGCANNNINIKHTPI
jgi:hypothetical protein